MNGYFAAFVGLMIVVGYLVWRATGQLWKSILGGFAVSSAGAVVGGIGVLKLEEHDIIDKGALAGWPFFLAILLGVSLLVWINRKSGD